MTTTSELTGLWQAGIPYHAEDGNTVVYSAPNGCALTMKRDGETSWAVVTTPSPFVHSDGPCTYAVVGALEPQTVALDVYQ